MHVRNVTLAGALLVLGTVSACRERPTALEVGVTLEPPRRLPTEATVVASDEQLARLDALLERLEQAVEAYEDASDKDQARSDIDSALTAVTQFFSEDPGIVVDPQVQSRVARLRRLDNERQRVLGIATPTPAATP
jgi:hypothetical protein